MALERCHSSVATVRKISDLRLGAFAAASRGEPTDVPPAMPQLDIVVLSELTRLLGRISVISGFDPFVASIS
jgi:hypothetical protein